MFTFLFFFFQLEAMTMMYHFCLIEDSGAAKVSTLPASSGSSIGSAVNNSNQNQSEILNNLLHVFLSSSDAKVPVVNFSSCQRNLIKTFQIEAMIALITKMAMIFS